MFPKPLSNTPVYTPSPCTVRVSEHTTDDHTPHDTLVVPEMECSSYQRRNQEVEVEQKDGERTEPELEGLAKPAQVSLQERLTMIRALSRQSHRKVRTGRIWLTSYLPGRPDEYPISLRILHRSSIP